MIGNTNQAFTRNKSSDALIFTGECYFKGFLVQPDGTNDVSITFYDNTTASGTKIIATITLSGSGGPQALQMPIQIKCFKGIYADITTSGTVEYTVFVGR